MSTTASIPEIAGQPLDAARAALGEPALRDEFDLTTRVPEFRVELRRFFAAERLEADPPRLLEATWHLTPERNLTIWYVEERGAWRYVHRAEWHPGEDF